MTESQQALCIRRLADGDAGALQYLIVEYHPMLRRAVGRAIEPALRRLVEPDDVLQQAYIVAFRKFADGRFDSPAHFYNWLQQIAQNELRGIQRGLHRRKRDPGRRLTAARPAGGRPHPVESYPDLLGRLTAGDTTPSVRLGRGEAVAAMMTSLARLSDDQRVVVQLRFLEDVPVAEIARRLGKTETAVYMLCHRGLKSLRELLGSLTQYLTKL